MNYSHFLPMISVENLANIKPL